MKSLITILAASAALSWPGPVSVNSQEAAETQPLSVSPRVEPSEEASADVLVEVQPEVEIELAPELGTVAAQAELRHLDNVISLKRDLDTVAIVAEAQQAVQLAQAAAPAGSRAVAAPATAQRLHSIVSKGRGGPGKALVIRTSDADAKGQGTLEEDLAVMSRILDKAVAKTLDDDGANRFMGINVLFAPGSGSIRSLYLEGYGALFLLSVNFPLLPPPDKAEPTKEKTETDSTWEEAKKELYGQSDAWGQVGKTFKFGLAPGLHLEYDKDKVDELKEGLLEALKNATNIRNVKADESITVCVFGGASAGPVKTGRAAVKRVPSESEAVFLSDPELDFTPARGTIMTVRVKKSDVDAFAKGKFNLDDFRKKSSITTYAGDAGGWSGATIFGKP